MVYVRPTEAPFTAITNYDQKTVSQLIADGIDMNKRDAVGRKALHVAILVKAEEIACDLIDAGAQMIVDGRNFLHLAAQMDMAVVIRKMMETIKGIRRRLRKRVRWLPGVMNQST